MSIQWNSEYSVGDAHIDAHHEELFHLISALDDVIHSNDRHRIEEIIQYLETYTLTHFEEEEAYMTSIDYADVDYHKREHDIFKLKVKELRTFYSHSAPNAHLIFQIRKFVDRLVDHILTVDAKMASST